MSYNLTLQNFSHSAEKKCQSFRGSEKGNRVIKDIFPNCDAVSVTNDI